MPRTAPAARGFLLPASDRIDAYAASQAARERAQQKPNTVNAPERARTAAEAFFVLPYHLYQFLFFVHLAAYGEILRPSRTERRRNAASRGRSMAKIGIFYHFYIMPK